MSNRYILYNQAVIPRDSLNLSPEEWFDISTRCMRQSLFASGNRIPFLKMWLEMMAKRFATVGWHLPDEFNYPDLRSALEKLLNRNRLFKGSWIHLLIIPVYPSTELDCSPGFRYIALTEDSEFDYFPLNVKGLSIGVSEKYRNTADPYYSSMIRNPIRDLMIRQEAAMNGWDEIILTDQDGNFSETSGSNIFIRIRNEIFTPATRNHGFPRMVTSIVSKLIPATGHTLSISDELNADILSKAEEIFITDDLRGIQWILGYEKKRYYRRVAITLNEELTELIRTTDQFQPGFSG